MKNSPWHHLGNFHCLIDTKIQKVQCLNEQILKIDLECYLECYLVSTSSMRGRIAKCNDYPERRLLLNLKKKKDMAVYETVAELALLY